ncbi:MAG: thioredoxin family protein [bacterium]
MAKSVKILGPGCPKCQTLLRNTEQAVAELGLECEVEKITDIMQITSFGVMMTPALVVDGEVRAVGKVPSLKELKEILS